MKPVWSHILLDLDGTLINSIDVFHDVDRRLFSAINIELIEADFHQMQMEDGFHVLRRILDERSSLNEEEKSLLMQNILEESVKGLADRVGWYPDVESFVQDSALKNIPLNIVTRSDTRDLATMELRIPVRTSIPVIVHGEDTKGRHKPDPYPLLLAAERLAISPESCIYVGDHKDDLSAAKAAGMQSCILLRKHVPATLAEMADYAIQSLADLHTLPLLAHA